MSFSQFGYPYSTTAQVRRVSSTHFCSRSAAAVQMSCSPSLFFFFFFPFPLTSSLFFFLKKKRAHLEAFFKKCACVFLSRLCCARLKQIPRSLPSKKALRKAAIPPSFPPTSDPPLPFHRAV